MFSSTQANIEAVSEIDIENVKTIRELRELQQRLENPNDSEQDPIQSAEMLGQFNSNSLKMSTVNGLITSIRFLRDTFF